MCRLLPVHHNLCRLSRSSQTRLFLLLRGRLGSSSSVFVTTSLRFTVVRAPSLLPPTIIVSSGCCLQWGSSPNHLCRTPPPILSSQVCTNQ
ncbi:hypothetical protein ACSQ67_000910 [Phaseolus vulgaris]